MARLIDADAFIKEQCNSCDGYCEKVDCDCLNCDSDCRCDMIKDLLDAPTVSPDEVRGVGKWIKRKKVRKNLPADSDYLYSCSVCGCGDEHNENVSVPFCWHCGAKMMEVSEDA